jgi:hypothetical protein
MIATAIVCLAFLTLAVLFAGFAVHAVAYLAANVRNV